MMASCLHYRHQRRDVVPDPAHDVLPPLSDQCLGLGREGRRERGKERVDGRREREKDGERDGGKEGERGRKGGCERDGGQKVMCVKLVHSRTNFLIKAFSYLQHGV